MSSHPHAFLWAAFLIACGVLWIAGLRLFVMSDLPRSRKLSWTAVLVLTGGAIGALLPLHGISSRFAVILFALPLLAIVDVVVVRSRRTFSFWLRACGFEVCTVFAVAALTRMLLDSRGLAPLIRLS